MTGGLLFSKGVLIKDYTVLIEKYVFTKMKEKIKTDMEKTKVKKQKRKKLAGI